MNRLLIALVGAGLMFGLTAYASDPKSEMVDLKTLPAAVQKTITEKAAGGKIVRVQREDDKNGKWNYNRSSVFHGVCYGSISLVQRKCRER